MIHRFVSFNENALIFFDEDAHVYTYKKEKLKSATAFIKDYEELFDSERISALKSNEWNVGQDEILNLWNSNGTAAAGFGTSIHAVLEHYFTYKKLGAQIQELSGKPKNAAMPNHPFLQQLIKELELIRDDGNTRQEVCISLVNKGVCGLVDDLLIVDAKKKRCRIRDYKITADILVDSKPLKAPFAFLGSNKLAKNFLQLSFYSYLMEMAGWKVDGIDIFNWDGSWHKHTLEGTPLIKAMLLIGTRL